MKALFPLLLVGCVAPTEPLAVDPLDLDVRLVSGPGAETLQAFDVRADGAALLVARHASGLTWEGARIVEGRGTTVFTIERSGAARALLHTSSTLDVVRAIASPRVVVAGGFFSTLDLLDRELVSQGAHDTAVLAIGDGVEWVVHLQSPGDTFVNGLAADEAGDVFIAGRFTRALRVDGLAFEGAGNDDAFVARIGSDGVRWLRTIGGPGRDAVGALALSPSGGVYVTGTHEDAIASVGLPDPGASRPFLLELDGDGELASAISFPGTGDADLASIVVDEDRGTVWVGGTFRGALTIGERRLVSRGQTDIVVARFTPDLAPLGVERYGDERLDVIEDMARDRFGRLWLVGSTRGALALADGAPVDDGLDGFFAALGPEGAVDLRVRLGGLDDQVGAGIGIAEDGQVVFAGQTSADLVPTPTVEAPADSDIFVGRLW